MVGRSVEALGPVQKAVIRDESSPGGVGRRAYGYCKY